VSALYAGAAREKSRRDILLTGVLDATLQQNVPAAFFAKAPKVVHVI
jgi:hypothetical protein